MSTTALRIAPAPKFAGLRSWDCTRCGREEVQPVFLADESGAALPYGSGCAARMLGRPPTAARKVLDEFAAVERKAAEIAEMIAERAAAGARALEAFRARDDYNADLSRMRRNYHSAREHGRIDADVLFPTYLETVAATGDV